MFWNENVKDYLICLGDVLRIFLLRLILCLMSVSVGVEIIVCL